MNVDVRGKNGFVVTEAIKRYADDKLQKIDHYFNQNLNAQVLCKTYKDHHKVEVTIPTKYFTMRAEVADEDMYAVNCKYFNNIKNFEKSFFVVY